MFGVLWLPSLREANQRLIGWTWVKFAYAVTYLVEVVRLAPIKTGSLLTVCVPGESQTIMTIEYSRDGGGREPLAAFAELSKIMLGEGSLNETLGRIAALARETIPDTDEVSVTFVDRDKANTVVFTGQLAMHLDERQYESGLGPCLDAALTGETVVVDVADDNLYQDFAQSARRAGVTHSVSVGLPVPQRVVGALNVYASTPDPLAEETISLAQAFASYAGVAVANAALYNRTAELADQMRAAMQSRSVIEQAKGILMGRHGCSADDAFKKLTRTSQHSHRKLRDIAQSIVDNTHSDQ
jgi:transcriptional regulator with GAF, ATPase, and Fis domain